MESILENMETRVPSWVDGFCHCLATADIGTISEKPLFVFSDFSGKSNSGRGKQRTLSFLICERNELSPWCQESVNWRSKWDSDVDGKPRSIQYKATGKRDSSKYHQLNPVLKNANLIRGVSITVSFRKPLIMTSDDNALFHWKSRHGLLAEWKPAEFEDALTTTHLLTLILTQCHLGRLDLSWICDKDNIFAKDDHGQDTATMLRTTLLHYQPEIDGKIKVAVSDETTEVEDLLSIPDLSAGAVGDAVTSGYQGVRENTKVIAPWLAKDSSHLIKRSFEIIDRGRGFRETRRIDSELARVN